jgi:hypothetical protein
MPIIKMIRAIGVFVALLLALAAVDNIAGFSPRSEDTPPTVVSRIRSSAPSLVLAIALLLPYRLFRKPPLRLGGIVVLLLLAFLVSAYGVVGVLGYLRGVKSWHIVPVMALFSTFIALNAWAFWRITAVNGRT